jgi:hypothetical protein
MGFWRKNECPLFLCNHNHLDHASLLNEEYEDETAFVDYRGTVFIIDTGIFYNNHVSIIDWFVMYDRRFFCHLLYPIFYRKNRLSKIDGDNGPAINDQSGSVSFFSGSLHICGNMVGQSGEPDDKAICMLSSSGGEISIRTDSPIRSNRLEQSRRDVYGIVGGDKRGQYILLLYS